MSASSPQFSLWHGIPRDTIPWFPTVNHDKCIGCELLSDQQDVTEFLNEVRALVRENQLVLVNENHV